MSEANGTRVEMLAVARVTHPDGSTTTTQISTSEQEAIHQAHQLDYAKAAELTARISQGIDHVEDLIKQAYLGRAWLVLGFDSWNAWVEHHFGDRRLIDVSREGRRETVASLHDAGMSSRQIGAVLGVDQRTVRRDLHSTEPGAAIAAPGDGESPTGHRVMGPDGKWYSSRKDIPRECDVCGGDHPEPDEDCPELEGLFDPIVIPPTGTADLPDGALDRTFGRRTGAGGAESDDESVEWDDEVDSEVNPYESNTKDPAAVAQSIVVQVRAIVEDFTRIRDDLEELPDLLGHLESILPEFPDRSGVRMPVELHGDGLAALEAVERWQAQLPATLERWSAALAGLRSVAE